MDDEWTLFDGCWPSFCIICRQDNDTCPLCRETQESILKPTPAADNFAYSHEPDSESEEQLDQNCLNSVPSG